ncbi:MAG TPA: tetratricopeptide repeat protein [Phycisphaerae bacterium]|nr:tetratricopeptide repeat protein [Phycisphaerae bacterium]
MARKVNTRFVITLGTVLGVVGLGGGGYFGYTILRNRNPVYLEKQGEAFEKQGDMVKAYTMYHRAAGRAATTHMEGGEALCMKTAEMAMKLSEQQTDRDSAQQFYREARGTWQAALTINPSYLPARERILEEDYQYISAIPSAGGWTMIQENADKLIGMTPKYANGYLYRATARYQLLISGASGSVDVSDALMKVQKDLQEGLKIAPDDGRAVSLLAITNFLLADQAAARSLNKQADKLREEGTQLLQKFLEKHPNDADTSIGLFGVLASKKPDEALKILEKAQAANPKDARLASALATVYSANQFDKAEKVMKEYIAANPTATEQYYILARLYEKKGMTPEAIAAYKNVLAHPLPGGGVAAFKNVSFQLQSYYSLSSLYMSLAEKEDPSTDAGKADLAEATNYADKFRAGGSLAGPQALLDARLQYLRKNINQALISLKKADANLGGTNPLPGQQEYWLTTKMLLAQVYVIQQQWGLALEQLDMVTLHYPDRALPVLQRAHLLNRVGRFSEALTVTQQILASQQLPAAMKDDALRTQAAAYYGMGNRSKADGIIASIDSIEATLVLARTQIARGQYDDAMDALNRVLEKEPNNQMALSLAIAVQVQLDRPADAHKLLDRALAKYPNNPGFQFMKAKLSQPNADTTDAQVELIKSITDDYSRSMFYAQLYHKTGQLNKELESLQAAEKALGEGANDALADVVQRSFSAALALTDTAKDAAEKETYWKIARNYVEKAQRLNLDGVNGALLQAELQYKQGDRRQAIATLEQTLSDHPDFSRAHTVLGLMYAEAGRMDSALDQFRQSIKEKPDDVAALKGAIRLLNQKGDPGSLEEARNDLKQAMIFAPRDPEVMAFADVLGDPASAIEVREQIYRKDPSNLDNLEHLAGLYVQSKQANKAIELLRPVYDKTPDDIRLADTLARLYRETGQTNEARTIYERFIGSNDPLMRFEGMLLLGELFNSLGQNDQAVETYKAAIGLAPAGDDRGQRRLADLYFEMDDMKDAEDLYHKIYDNQKTKDMGVLRRIVETQIRQGKYADADQILKNEIFKQNPNDAEGLVLQGYSLLRQGNSKDALASFNAVLDKDPNNPDALHYRAYAQYTLQGDLDQAAKDLMAVRDRNRNAINSRLLLARVYRLSHRLSEAASEYRDVIALRPDLIPARVEYAQYLLQLAKVQQNLLPDNQDDIAYMIRSMDPIQTLQAFLVDSSNRFPKDPTWQIFAGDLLSLVGHREDALKMYEQAFNASSGSPRAAASYLDALIRSGRYEEAIALVTKIGTVRANSADDYVKRASAYAATHKQEEAFADFGRALDLVDQDLNLATVVSHQMMVALPGDKVVSFLQERVKANPTSTASRLALGQALLNNNQAAEAARILAPMRNDAKIQDKAMVLRSLALAEYQAKDFNSANTDYQELLKIVPDDIESLNNLSFMLADNMKNPKEGLVYATRAAKILRQGEDSIAFVNNGNVYDTLGWVEILNGDTDAGIRDLRRAIQSEPSTIAYYHLGRAYQKAGRKDDARKAVQDGLKLASGQNDPMESQLVALQGELGK